MTYLVYISPKGLKLGGKVKLVVLYADGSTAVISKQRFDNQRHNMLVSAQDASVSFTKEGKRYDFNMPKAIVSAARKQGIPVRRSNYHRGTKPFLTFAALHMNGQWVFPNRPDYSLKA